MNKKDKYLDEWMNKWMIDKYWDEYMNKLII